MLFNIMLTEYLCWLLVTVVHSLCENIWTRVISAFLETKKVLLCMFDTSTESAFLTLIFIKFACSVKKLSVSHTSAYHRKKSTGSN